MRIYLTHCSAKKDDSLRESSVKVSPDNLYTATPIRRFMNRCKTVGVQWAIFSDLHGVWFPDEKHEWYEKDPNSVTDREFSVLVREFDEKLAAFDQIWFYVNPGRFHPLYRRLLRETKLNHRITKFTHITEITEA